MLEEHAVVALTSDIPSAGLVTGNVGTVVHVYSPEMYEVEFVDDTGHTYGLLTLNPTQILRLQFAPVAAA